jgi:hypothetical protein
MIRATITPLKLSATSTDEHTSVGKGFKRSHTMLRVNSGQHPPHPPFAASRSSRFTAKVAAVESMQPGDVIGQAWAVKVKRTYSL